MIKKLKIITFFILFFSFTSCFKEPNKGNNTNVKTLKVNQLESKKTVTDSINNYDEEVSSFSEIDKLNNRIDELTNQLNLLLSENDISGGRISILDRERGIFQFNNNCRFKIFDVILYYKDEDNFDGFGKHHLVLECSLKEDCIKYTYDNGYIIGVTTPIKSKEKGYEAIEIFEKIKETYYAKNNYVSENY